CRLVLRCPPGSALFPYTTLFRSVFGDADCVSLGGQGCGHGAGVCAVVLGAPEAAVQEDHEWAAGSLVDVDDLVRVGAVAEGSVGDRKSTRLNSSHVKISYAVFCL